MLQGYSSRLPYDECAYGDKLKESVGPMEYRLSPDQMYNCNSCLSTLGPRSSNLGRGYDISRPFATGYAASQDLVDVESNLSNRHIKTSKCKSGNVNTTDVNKYKLKNVKLCDNTLNPETTRLSAPASNYRSMSVNRFYNLPKDPQANIFWDNAINSRLEATDNYKPDIPVPWIDMAGPLASGKSSDYVSCETTTICNKGGKKVKCPSSWKN
jgi:hypothetical protein